MQNEVIETDSVEFKGNSCVQDCPTANIWSWIKRNFASIIAFLSLIVNIIIASVVCPRIVDENHLNFDYIGIIVGVLSLLVTVLMTWNIYTVIDIRKVKKEAFAYINKELSEKGRDWVVSVLCYADTLNVDDYLMKKKPEFAIDFLFRAIENCAGKPYSESAINSAITKLYIVCCEYNKDNTRIFKSKRNKYLSLLSKIEGTYVPFITTAISNASEITDCPYNN